LLNGERCVEGERTTEKNSRTRKTPCRDIKGWVKKKNVKEMWEKRKKKKATEH